jgi:hypothetical protein
MLAPPRLHLGEQHHAIAVEVQVVQDDVRLAGADGKCALGMWADRLRAPAALELEAVRVVLRVGGKLSVDGDRTDLLSLVRFEVIDHRVAQRNLGKRRGQLARILR